MKGPSSSEQWQRENEPESEKYVRLLGLRSSLLSRQLKGTAHEAGGGSRELNRAKVQLLPAQSIATGPAIKKTLN
jgi:hypothetical protein